MNLRADIVQKILHAVFVIDESGSMEDIKEQTITGINEQIQELRKNTEVAVKVTLVTFNTSKRIHYQATDITEVNDIPTSNYNPNGGTAMLDAIGDTIEMVSETKVENTAYLLAIFTDGYENSSTKHTYETVANLITKCKESKVWTITYLGANQDLSIVQQKLNIDMSNMANYTASKGGTRSAFRRMSDSTNLYAARFVAASADTMNNTMFYSASPDKIEDIPVEPDQINP